MRKIPSLILLDIGKIFRLYRAYSPSNDGSMLKAIDTQYKLMEDGRIFYQENPTNPLPGNPVAQVMKGERILLPSVVLLETEALKDQDTAAVMLHIQGWLARHIGTVLEPLATVLDDPEMKDPARAIAQQVSDGLGIVPREQIEALIATLDADDRKALRQKKIQLGPVLVFIPALNKPAAVRLRALLWGLAHDKPLPMTAPKDGIVSFVVEVPSDEDKAFYQAVGYPVFGTRAIRIDMLGRVITAVYDSAKDGKFRARHDMAEWLGSSIEGLYEVLEAMGHRKIEEEAPAEMPVEAVEPVEPVQISEPVEPIAEEGAQAAAVPTPVQNVKPVLALFRLKKGKAFEKPAFKKTPFKKPDALKHKPAFTPKPKADEENFAKRPAHKDKRKPVVEREARVMQTGPKARPEDSPFAILGQLKDRV